MKFHTRRKKASKKLLQLVLTLRDLGILVDLYLFQVLLSGQIGELHFAGITDRRRNRRLHMLAGANLVVGGPLPLGPLATSTPGTAAGLGGQWLYQLGPAATEIIASHLGVSSDDVRRRIRKGSPTARAHALEIAQCYIALRHIVSRSGGRFQVQEFRPEAFFTYRLNLSNGTSQEERFRPDAHVRIQQKCLRAEESITRDLFIEVDLGHTSGAEWDKKLQTARRFCEAVLPKLRAHTASQSSATPTSLEPLFLVLTTTQTRAANLSQIMRQSLGDALPERLVATFTDLATLADPRPTLPYAESQTPDVALSSPAQTRLDSLAAFLGLSPSGMGSLTTAHSSLPKIPAEPEKDLAR